MFDLTGKVAVVTGGSSGLGVQFAHALGRQGASVVVIARREHMLKKVAEDIAAESGVRTAYYVCDVTKSASVAETAEKIVRDFGTIDIAVNCAGGGNCGTRRDRQPLEDGADLLQLAGSLVGLVGCVIDLIPELVRLLGGIPHLIVHGVDGSLVLVKLPLHIVQSGLGIVELDLPLLGAPVVFPEGGGSVLQRLAESLDFLLLGIDLLAQHPVPGGEGFHGIIIFVKLRLYDLHFRAEDFEGLVDVRQRLLEFLFALQPDLVERYQGLCSLPAKESDCPADRRQHLIG